MDNNSQNFSLAQWTKYNFWGWLLGVALILLLSSLLESIGIHHMQFYLGTGMGAGVGFVQWRLLKKQKRVSADWILISILGMSIPFLVFDILPDDYVSHKLAISIIFGSLLTGISQALLLKHYYTKTKIWIFASLCGWCLSVSAVFLVDYTRNLTNINLLLFLINLILILSGGVVYGCITGIFMRGILKEGNSEIKE